jgi:hypothetical protein
MVDPADELGLPVRPPAIEKPSTRRVTWKRALGACLVLFALGLLLSFLALIVAISPMIGTLAQEDVFWSPWRIARRFLYLAVPFGFLYFGLVLAERQKICVLYLRRFGLNVNIISPRYGKGLARDMRLITLDDRKFSPSAAPKADVWLSRLTPAIVLVVIVLLGVLVGSAPLTEGSEGQIIGTAIGLSFATGMALFLLFSSVLHEYRIWRASRIVLDTADQLDRASMVVRAASQWWMRPALLGRAATVVSVRDELWQSAVQRLSRDTNAVVVDISGSSSNLDWELTLLRSQKIPYVLIAEDRNRSDEPPQPNESARPSDPGDPKIFTYDLADRRGLKQFRLAVASELRRIASPIKFAAPSRRPLLRSALRLLAVYASIFVIAAAGAALPAMYSIPLYLSLLRKD